jgi:hypothetical protein
MLHFVLAGAAAVMAGTCEPWCREPCHELNGDVTRECAGCPADGDFGCFPGAKGYLARAVAEDDDGRVAAEAAYVQASGATRPLTQSSTPLKGGGGGGSDHEDASRHSAAVTGADRAAVDAIGGPRAGCHTAACSRVRIEELGKANARAPNVRADGTVLAGGEEVPCDFQRVDRAALASMGTEERREFLTRLPTVIRGLADDWPAMHEWREPRSFAERFGHHRVKAIRANKGFQRMESLVGRACLMFDEEGCPGQRNASISFAEVIAWSAEEQVVIMDLPDMLRGEHDLLGALSTAYDIPEFLECISAVRLLSLGGRPEGVQMSAHHSAWLAVVVGAKLWHLAPPTVPKPKDRHCPNRGKVDRALATAEGVLHCMAYPGEVVVVPDNWWHATCNMLPFTLAIGSQTWDSEVRVPFAARTDAARAATTKRWRQGEPLPLNRYQSSVSPSLEEGEPLGSNHA